jgi:hypothetical protein
MVRSIQQIVEVWRAGQKSAEDRMRDTKPLRVHTGRPASDRRRLRARRKEDGKARRSLGR